MPSDAPYSRKRFALALLLAHVAAAYALALAMLLTAGVGNLFEPDTFAGGLPSLGRILEGAAMLPLLAGAMALPAAILLIPYSIVGALIALPFVAARRVGPVAASLIGGGTGLCLGMTRAWISAPDTFRTHWDIGVLMVEGSALAAGTAFGWMIWRVAIRPAAPPRAPHTRLSQAGFSPHP